MNEEGRLFTQGTCSRCKKKTLIRAYADIQGKVEWLCNDCYLQDFKELILKEKVRLEK